MQPNLTSLIFQIKIYTFFFFSGEYYGERTYENELFEKATEYYCKFCPYTSPILSNLKRHLLIHSDIRPFTCSICNHGFRQKVTLDRHMLIHTGSQPYTCTLCDFKCRRKAYLKNHYVAHHKLEVEGSNPEQLLPLG